MFILLWSSCRRGFKSFGNHFLMASLCIAIASTIGRAQQPRIELQYPLGPDSLSTHEWKISQVFPGAVRRYYVYVPAQYKSEEPASLMVFQDGHAYIKEDGDFRVPVVFDNLIHKGDMPVTIGVFVDPGHKKAELPPEPGWQPQPENRSLEYDTLSGDYAKFLLDEILPAVGKDHPFTEDPERHAICGMSSGGICAFTVAWQRPDAFRKVLSHIGSFTNIRGGDAYPGMIRKGSDKKPLRVFLQDGSNDLDNEHGNWPLGNQQMFAALKFRKYDVKLVYGEGAHTGNHGGAIFPDSLRWLWRDHK
jgi:predicted alpha/beta superfamily hydrolase